MPEAQLREEWGGRMAAWKPPAVQDLSDVRPSWPTSKGARIWVSRSAPLEPVMRSGGETLACTASATAARERLAASAERGEHVFITHSLA